MHLFLLNFQKWLMFLSIKAKSWQEMPSLGIWELYANCLFEVDELNFADFCSFSLRHEF